MSDNSKPKRKVAERRPAGIKAMPAPAPRALPEDHPARSLFKQAAREESAGLETPPSPGPPQAHPQPTPGPVAPERDFYKRPNSIEREAVPAGLFPGGTKNTYDALYQRTRGAVVPVRSIQATKRQLMGWAGVCNEKTIESHVKHLIAVGLFVRTGALGDNRGQFYEVFTPEEIGAAPLSPTPPQAQAHPSPPPAQKLAPPQAQKLPPGGLGKLVDTEGTYANDKTSFKTKDEKTDDEAFADLLAVLKRTAKKVTGSDPSAAERARWKEVAEFLATELEVAASRTTVTSAPAFLAEHLRRRLRKADARQIEREVGEASSRPTSAPPKPELTAEQIQEQVNLMVGLMRGGSEMRELEERFAAEFRPAQWHMIRSIALAQASAAGPGAGNAER